jgi:hypothetical protein
MKEPNCWTVRDIEGKPSECFCTINLEYHMKHCRYNYQIVFEGDGDNKHMSLDKKGMIKTIPVVNSNYDPRIKKPRKPLYCKGKPTDHCYAHNCPHFSYTDYDPTEEDTPVMMRQKRKKT